MAEHFTLEGRVRDPSDSDAEPITRHRPRWGAEGPLSRLPRLALLFPALLLGCPTGDDDTSGDDDTTAPDPDDDDSADGGIVGGVQLMEMATDNPPGGFSPSLWIWGIYDRPLVGQIFGVVAEMMWEVTLAEGDCVYLDAMVPGFCDPPCENTQYCTGDGECEEWPAYRPAGELTIGGLTQPLALTPHDSGFYLMADLPTDLFDEGATVTLTAAGGETPAFETLAVAPPMLVPEIPCELDLAEGDDLVLTWDPDDGGATIRWACLAAARSPSRAAWTMSMINCGAKPAKPTSAPSAASSSVGSRYSSWQVMIETCGAASFIFS